MTPSVRLTGALALIVAGLSGCGVSHHARPLGKNNHAVHVSVGGPVVGVAKADTYLPLITTTYKYGLTDRADFFVGWHVLETFVNNGNAYFDIGASYYFLDQRSGLPGVSAAFTVSPLLNKTSAWASFDLQVTASWAFGRQERHLVYTGFHNWFAPPRTEFRTTDVYSFVPYVGGTLRLGPRREVGLGLEVKWIRPYANTGNAVLGWLGPGKQGALSFLGGVTFHVGSDAPSTPDPRAPTSRKRGRKKAAADEPNSGGFPPATEDPRGASALDSGTARDAAAPPEASPPPDQAAPPAAEDGLDDDNATPEHPSVDDDNATPEDPALDDDDATPEHPAVDDDSATVEPPRDDDDAKPPPHDDDEPTAPPSASEAP